MRRLALGLRERRVEQILGLVEFGQVRARVIRAERGQPREVFEAGVQRNGALDHRDADVELRDERRSFLRRRPSSGRRGRPRRCPSRRGRGRRLDSEVLGEPLRQHLLARLRAIEPVGSLGEGAQPVEDGAIVGHARALSCGVGELVVAGVLCRFHVVFDEPEAVPGPPFHEEKERVGVVGRERVHALELHESGLGRGMGEFIVADGVEGVGGPASRLDLPVREHLREATWECQRESREASDRDE